jgi:hypothetical protein
MTPDLLTKLLKRHMLAMAVDMMEGVLTEEEADQLANQIERIIRATTLGTLIDIQMYEWNLQHDPSSLLMVLNDLVAPSQQQS